MEAGHQEEGSQEEKEKEVKTENITGGRKKKKARLERLENWGEAEKESETDVRSWLLKPTETPRTSKRMKQLEMEFSGIRVVTIMQTPKPSPTLEKEVSKEDTTPLAKGLTTPKPRIKGGKKLPKKESMELIKKTNTRITSWIKPKQNPAVKEDDWSDDISIPEIQCTEDIERREYAKIKAECWMGKRICRELIVEMIRRAESVSSISA